MHYVKTTDARYDSHMFSLSHESNFKMQYLVNLSHYQTFGFITKHYQTLLFLVIIDRPPYRFR